MTGERAVPEQRIEGIFPVQGREGVFPAQGSEGVRRRRRKAEVERVTVAIINHNGSNVLPATLAALGAVRKLALDILLLDDASVDGGVEWVERHHPEVKVVRFPPPAGRPSRLRNWALRNAETRYVLLLDNDISLEPDCLSHLVQALSGGRDVLACSPALVCSEKPDTLYLRGNQIHYLGIATDAFRGQRRQSEDDSAPPVPTIAGGNVLVDRVSALRLGLFDEEYDFGWGEDSELFARGVYQGLDTLLVPAAVARHVERPKGISRAEAQLYNRHRFILTHYSPAALVLLGPALLVFEACLLSVSVAKGAGGSWARATRRVFADRRGILSRRARLQGRRRHRDSELLVGESFVPTGAMAGSRVIGAAAWLANGFFGAYWSLVRRWL